MATTRSRRSATPPPKRSPRAARWSPRAAGPLDERSVELLVGAAVAPALVAKATGLLDAWTSVVFWVALGLALALAVSEVRAGSPDRERREGDRAVLGSLLGLVLVVPVLFDPRVLDAVSAPKLAVAAPGGLALAGLWLLRARSAPAWRNGAHWPALALLGWSAASGLVAGSFGLALIGADLSADGLLLLAGCVGMFFAVAGGLGVGDVVKVVRLLVVGVGGVVGLYGLMQLHDRVWGGSWDWAPWADVSFSSVSIWSTLGNPNHLAGFLAALVPLGVGLVLVDRRRWVRVLAGAVTCVALIEIVQAAARGGWVATATGAIVLAALLAREVPTRTVVIGVTGALLFAVVIGGAALGSHTVSLGGQLRSMVQLADNSTTTERLQYWGASVDIARQHPVFGVGPDGFRFAYPAVQDEGYVRVFGAEQTVNGPHNMFLNQLATTGGPGLLALLAVLAAVGAQGIRALRALRTSGAEGRADRVLLSALLAAVSALVVQGAFNVQQVTTSFSLWLLLGLVLVFAPRVPSGRAVGRPPWVIPTGVSLVACSLVALWAASAPWRGEIAYADAVSAQDQGARQSDPASAEAQRLFTLGTRRLQDAIDADPWRARYHEVRASAILDAARRQVGAPDANPGPLAQLALEGFERAVSVEPDSARLREGLGDAYLLQVDIGFRRELGEAAVDAYEAALERNPWVGRVRAKLARVLVALDRPEDALAELDVGLRYLPGFDVYRGLGRVHDALEDGESAQWWRKALEASPGDPESRAALETAAEAP